MMQQTGGFVNFDPAFTRPAAGQLSSFGVTLLLYRPQSFITLLQDAPKFTDSPVVVRQSQNYNIHD